MKRVFGWRKPSAENWIEWFDNFRYGNDTVLPKDTFYTRNIITFISIITMRPAALTINLRGSLKWSMETRWGRWCKQSVQLRTHTSTLSFEFPHIFDDIELVRFEPYVPYICTVSFWTLCACPVHRLLKRNKINKFGSSNSKRWISLVTALNQV